MSSLSEAGIWVAAIAAGVAGLVYLARLVRNVVHASRNMVRAIGAIQHLVERELDHNHGSSMKDDLTGMAIAIGKLQRDRESDRRRLRHAMRLAAKHHPEDAWLYLEPEDRKPK